MKTLIFKINNLTDNDKDVIKSLQKDYSISFRKLYNNIDKIKDKPFLNTLPIKSTKQIEYLQKEIEKFYKIHQANKLRIQNNINKLESKSKLSLKEFKHLQYLHKSLNKNICFGNKNELIKLSKGEGNLDIWQESRLLPLVFYGETSKFGNRFFDLKTISEGKIIFKYTKDLHINLIFNTKRHKNDLIKLQELILNKEIPVTVKLTSELLYITFDESKLAGNYLDINKYYKEINHVIDSDKRKELIANHYREHENKLKENKLDRVLAIDLNPDGIGYSVLNKDLIIVAKGFINVSKLLNADKRKYETTIMIKHLFKLIKHYRCHSIVIEDLTGISSVTDLGNKISNRKVKNLWNRELINNIITRRCNEQGIIKVEVNPAYSSFIGNILHNEYDPIASSLEIGRRGLNKYKSKSQLYPDFCIDSFVNDKRYDKIKLCKNWKDLRWLFITSKWNYRRSLSKFKDVIQEHKLESYKSQAQVLVFK